MEPKHVIDIVGISCPPKSDRDFNKWYEEKHIPARVKFKGLTGAIRYQLAGFTESATVNEYPRFLTACKFKDLATFTAWNAGPELREGFEGAAELFARLGVDLLWRVQYESIKTWKKTPPLSTVHMVGTQSRLKAEFDRWYSEKHIPDLLKFNALLGVTRYELASSVGLRGMGKVFSGETKEYPQFLTFYFFKDIANFEAYEASPERTGTLDEWQQVMKDMGVSLLWRVRYKPVKSWQQ
jgi:antibiotic biosynthesis monooxygenase (ABM) superfamily enzyme